MNTSHHMHHGHHHHHAPDINSTVGSVISTTATTIMQAAVSTVMSHADHQSSMGASHAGHTMDLVADSKDSILSGQSDFAHDHDTSSADHMMKMYFHFGIDTVILFKEWTTTTTGGLVASVFGIFILAMLYEGIKFFREYLFKRYFTSLEYSSVSVVGDDGKTVTEVHKVARSRIFSWPHILQTYLHVVQMVLSYFLMLIFMTYNVWLCLAVVLGAGLGYFMFGWRKATVVDITEHCH